MARKIIWLGVVFCFFPLISLANGKVIYFAKVTDVSGDVNLVYEFTYVGNTSVEARKGDSGIRIPFNKIKFLEITNHEGVKPLLPKLGNVFFPSIVTLTSGEKIKVLVASAWFGGKTEFADNYIIEAAKIKSVEFLHDGRYKQCPLCHTIYYNTEMEYCKFDGEKLVKK